MLCLSVREGPGIRTAFIRIRSAVIRSRLAVRSCVHTGALKLCKSGNGRDEILHVLLFVLRAGTVVYRRAGRIPEMGGFLQGMAHAAQCVHPADGVSFSVPGGAERSGCCGVQNHRSREASVYPGTDRDRKNTQHGISGCKGDGGGKRGTDFLSDGPYHCPDGRIGSICTAARDGAAHQDRDPDRKGKNLSAGDDPVQS